jgi:carboxymethylenebutenolidase
MCYPFDAQPPEAPGQKQEISERDVVLESKDGTKFQAFYAAPAQGDGTGIVVLPDIRGLFNFYEEFARGFARQGINAIAIDYFGRTAGVSKRDADFEWAPHVAATKAPQISDDTGAAVAYLRSPEGGSCSSIFTVGFCFGGANSWLQAANGHGLAGVIGFYGRPGPGRDGAPGPLARAAEMTCPVLMLMGGADQGIPVEQAEELKAALDAAGVPNELKVYEGAPHSFFDRTYQEHADASADAWQRVLSFIAANKRATAGVA